MNPLSLLIPIFTFAVTTEPFNPHLLNKIEGEWSVVAQNHIDNKTCYFVNITQENNEVYWKEDYQLKNQTVFYQEKILSKNLQTFFSKDKTYQIIFNSYFKDFIVINKNSELLVLSRNFHLTYDEYFYLGVVLNLVSNENIYFVNNNFNFC